jgi:two-component system sensor histidine kinase BaeS
MERITGDLQLLALAESGDLVLDLRRCDAAAVVRDLAEAYRVRTAASDVALHVQIAGPLRLETDPARLRQILDNLLSNALRHTPAGGRIDLDAVLVDGTVRIAVVDTGEGIPAADLPRIFDRLWRGEPSRVRAGRSTGLGLSIARGLAEALGGRLTARSTLGEGSHFEVVLPAAEAHQRGASRAGE